jgi:hypothetical protein
MPTLTSQLIRSTRSRFPGCIDSIEKARQVYFFSPLGDSECCLFGVFGRRVRRTRFLRLLAWSHPISGAVFQSKVLYSIQLRRHDRRSSPWKWTKGEAPRHFWTRQAGINLLLFLRSIECKVMFSTRFLQLATLAEGDFRISQHLL